MPIPVTPGWRMWLLLLISGIMAALLSVMISVLIAERNTREQVQRIESAKQQATTEQRQAACQLVGGILAAYEETPPTTPAGKNVVQAWLDEYRIIGCTPGK